MHENGSWEGLIKSLNAFQYWLIWNKSVGLFTGSICVFFRYLAPNSVNVYQSETRFEQKLQRKCNIFYVQSTCSVRLAVFGTIKQKRTYIS
jgi:hypothetical protein